MRPALLLIDAQHDFLTSPGLQPSRVELCAALARLLQEGRRAGIPVVHVWTTVDADRPPMPHWSPDRARRFQPGGEGHATPSELRPVAGEVVVHKRFFSGFGDGSLEEHLRQSGVDTVILAGLHLRACIRTTAIDAYQRGFAVWIADGAVGDDDPLHGTVSRQYLATRFARIASHDELPAIIGSPGSADRSDGAAAVAGIEHVSPHDGRHLFWVPACTRQHVAAAVESAERGVRTWQTISPSERTRLLLAVADRLAGDSEPWARRIVLETGKPLLEARREVLFAEHLVRSTVRSADADQDAESGPGWLARRRPHGVVALVTPWNNPLAIPLGKIAPALAHGNTAVWKPAIAASGVALAVHRLLMEAGLPEGVVNVLPGDHRTAEFLLDHPLVRAASLTGSSAAGYAAQAICARRRIPLQAELGGNNAAIVWSDADLRSAAREIAVGGFGSAGQRCTANRRVIVEGRIHEAFVAELLAATDALPWGDPFDEATVVGPLISRRACRRVADAVTAAQATGAVARPRRSGSECLRATGAYFPPTVVFNATAMSDIVQEETFGPVVVVLSAGDWEEAIGLCNGVQQGLVASLFSDSEALQDRFLNEAHAGILKLNQSTAGVAADAPFGGWKSSGIGPPEHGPGDRDFYTRIQTVYRGRA